MRFRSTCSVGATTTGGAKRHPSGSLPHRQGYLSVKSVQAASKPSLVCSVKSSSFTPGVNGGGDSARGGGLSSEAGLYGMSCVPIGGASNLARKPCDYFGLTTGMIDGHVTGTWS